MMAEYCFTNEADIAYSYENITLYYDAASSMATNFTLLRLVQENLEKCLKRYTAKYMKIFITK